MYHHQAPTKAKFSSFNKKTAFFSFLFVIHFFHKAASLSALHLHTSKSTRANRSF
jgi:hypothetical protein